MYYVANLESRSVLTYRDGARVVDVCEARAKSFAEANQEASGFPHAVVPVADTRSDSLSREVASVFRAGR